MLSLPIRSITFRAAGFATVVLLAGSLAAQAVKSPSKPVSAGNEAVSARNTVALRAKVGKTVTVQGRIGSTGEARSGRQFLNFSGSELTAVCAPADVAKFRAGKPSELYRNKNVKLTGKVELFKGKVQIPLSAPSQIQIIAEPKTVPPKGITLKKIGRETWLSPAGLRYQGRDPAGRTRIEHIERHAKDEPRRDGPHGVFDGGNKVAFAVIDEAWGVAKKRKLKPNREGDRSSYTVSMGRRIGFLGGRTGASKRNPPLTRVFIVFNTGTNEIITAFPK